MSKWISVEDATPEHEHCVICTDDPDVASGKAYPACESIFGACYLKDKGYFTDTPYHDYEYVYKVTHWMELPDGS